MLFKDVIGQNELKKKLVSTILEERISHAQLFEGLSGYGSLPLAIAYAQFISCSNKTDDDSCGVCPSCKKYNKLIHPDLHFVFPVNTTSKFKESEKLVSNNFLTEWREIVLQRKYFSEQEWYEHIGIEKQGNISKFEAENIIAKLNLRPYESDTKIMIIWLPERLNTAAANRLLKLIEEPPKNTVFLLVTENAGKVLPTIYSRTQRIRLSPINEENIADCLRQEGYEEKDIFSASRLCKGDYIRAKQVLTTSDSEKAHFDNFVKFMRLSYMNDILGLLEWAETIASFGRERQKSFLVCAERLLRENFILNSNPEIVYLSFDEFNWAKKFHSFINENNVFELYKLLNDCIPQISQNGNSKIIFTDLALKTKELIRTK